jgi:glycosyltransferase involved in cell wall biosynthesis
VAARRPSASAPYAGEQFSWMPQRYEYSSEPDDRELLPALESFQPQLLLVGSWNIRAYRRACRRFSGRALRVCCMDNQWQGKVKQWAGVLASRWYLHPLYDAIFTPGERQAAFARRLGFHEGQIWRGIYACDHAAFSAVYQHAQACRKQPPRAFIYAGRLAPEKQITTLLAAYGHYREHGADAWPLIVAGTGPLQPEVCGMRAIDYRSFVQPELLPQLFAQASCLLLPSSSEAWGVVIQEAAAAGLAVICSSCCGAAVHLLQDGYNGYLVEAGNAGELAGAMVRYSSLNEERRRGMSAASHSLSWQFTPERWAETVLERAARAI